MEEMEKRTPDCVTTMSAPPPIADMSRVHAEVRYVPQADVGQKCRRVRPMAATRTFERTSQLPFVMSASMPAAANGYSGMPTIRNASVYR
jgi:hypothetical protein